MESHPLETGMPREIGNWVIQEQIGEGGMGTVYLAHHRTLAIPAALKVLSPTYSRDPKLRERFKREAKAQAQLQHPGIARVMDFLEDGHDLYIVIEYLPGGTLADRLENQQGPIPLAQALSWARQVLSALDSAHQHGVIHRDIKPSNLMFDGEGQIKVVDFGIAKTLDGRRLTTGSAPLGTPHYMSPEQIRRPKDIDHRTDVYSVGVVLYEMLAGKAPFDGGSHFDVESAQVNNPPPPLRQHNPEIPEELEALVRRALEKDPDQRFSGCGELARALEKYEKESSSKDRKPPEPDPPAQGTAKTWQVAFVCAVGIIVGLGLALALKTQEASRRGSSLDEAVGEQIRLQGELETTRAASASLNSQLEATRQRLAKQDLIRQARSWPLNFSDNFLYSSSRWGQGEYSTSGGKGYQKFVNGEYWWRAESLRASGWSADRNLSPSSQNYYLTATARSIFNPPDTYWRLIFRKSGRDFYSFQIDSDSYSIWKEGTSSQELRPWTRSPLIRSGERNQLAVLARGSNMIFLINGEIVDELEDSSYATGGVEIGVGFRSPGKAADFAFSGFEVRRAPS